MHMITLHLSGPAGEQPDPDQLAQAMWAQAETTDRVEHLRIRSHPGRVDVVAFLLADEAEAARARARELGRRTITGTAWLAGWSLEDT
ncbi:hypothetical protein DN069_13880 [Streptacidiphilus pinicola]|uniref:Uncharacterized protein n=1 Tax=Streptacidiphilus pinicola TaxID=2219663 RepID=A0A2X0IIV6_9ACTN|nr:hypothetical protein [Streptacidiphilus pinicola]RAG85044.1 hypothetical protein DN069_13880 [Streptacidiphilus pinicola]